MIQGRGDTNTPPAILKINLSIDFIKVKEVLTNSGLSKNCGKNCVILHYSSLAPLERRNHAVLIREIATNLWNNNFELSSTLSMKSLHTKYFSILTQAITVQTFIEQFLRGIIFWNYWVSSVIKFKLSSIFIDCRHRKKCSVLARKKQCVHCNSYMRQDLRVRCSLKFDFGKYYVIKCIFILFNVNKVTLHVDCMPSLLEMFLCILLVYWTH